MAAKIPFVENFDKWRKRVNDARRPDKGAALEGDSLMSDDCLQYIEVSVELRAAIDEARRSLREHFIAPNEASKEEALAAVDALDGLLDYAKPNARAESMSLSWLPKV